MICFAVHPLPIDEQLLAMLEETIVSLPSNFTTRIVNYLKSETLTESHHSQMRLTFAFVLAITICFSNF